MNWRLSQLDNIALISNGDSHSPQKIAREANVFDTDLSYNAIYNAIKTKNPKEFLYTIEFFPEEGKYHFDGHKDCGVAFSPKQTKQNLGICPVCKKPLTIGVLNRVNELADREDGFIPKGAIPFKSLIPLAEIIADYLSVGVTAKSVSKLYNTALLHFTSELDILLNTPQNDLKTKLPYQMVEGILKVRAGKAHIEPGYDGVYGKVSVFTAVERKENKVQKLLF